MGRAITSGLGIMAPRGYLIIAFEMVIAKGGTMISVNVTEGSGRGTCRKCKEPIAKGAMQLVAEVNGGRYHEGARWHIKCVFEGISVITVPVTGRT